MTLTPSHNYLKAALSWLLVALFLAYQVFVGIQVILAVAAHWDPGLAPGFAGGFLIIFPIVLVDAIFAIAPMAYIGNERRLRAAALRDPAITPPASYQPRRELALADGETLRLGRVQSGWMVGRQLLLLFVLAGFVLVLGEGMLIMSLPGLAETALNPMNLLFPILPVAPLSSVSPLDWICVAGPLVFGLLIMPWLGYSVLRTRHDTLVADDRGLTHKRSWGQRFIPWSDIQVFMRPGATMSDSPAGSYMVWGGRHGLTFVIHARPASAGSAARQARSYHFSGGYETYERDAKRLLATIVARGYQPLIYWTGTATAFGGVRRRFPDLVLTEESALALPAADATLQPGVDAVAAARARPAPDFRLAARLRFSWLGLVVESLVYFALINACAYLQGAFSSTGFSPAGALTGDIVSQIGLAISIPMLAIFSVALAVARRAGRMPGVTVTPEGLKGRSRGSGSGRVETIAWGDMRAWVVTPATRNGKRPAMYTVFGADGERIRWAEPERAQLAGRGVRGDRAEAFRERAGELHALIVARTGLALRDGTPALPTEMAAPL